MLLPPAAQAARALRPVGVSVLRRRAFSSAAAEHRQPRVLYVHGLESGVRGLKARFLAEKFADTRCVAMPNSPTAKRSAEDYEECLELQREAVDSFKPDVIVGSSFGGGLCLDLIGRGHWEGPAVLLCQAFQLARPKERVPWLLPGVPYCLVHGRRDAVVPPEHSHALKTGAVVYNSHRVEDPESLVRLVEPDDTHGLKTTCGVPADPYQYEWRQPGYHGPGESEAQPLPPELWLDRLVQDLWEKWVEQGESPLLPPVGLPKHTLLGMPALSPVMTEGTVWQWNVGVGDKVAAGDYYCEVETDKAVVPFLVEDDGFVAKILLEEGTPAPIGAPVGVVVEHEADIAAFEDYVPPSDLPEHTVLGMPHLSPTMVEGAVSVWHVEPGDEIEPGDELCDIEMDKASVALEAHDNGFLAKILPDGESGTRVPVGTPVAVLVKDKADIAAFEDFEPPDQQ